MQAAARLEAAVERLASVLETALATAPGPDAAEAEMLNLDRPDMVSRAEVAAIAERLEATILRLRAALPEELRPDGEVRTAEIRSEGT